MQIADEHPNGKPQYHEHLAKHSKSNLGSRDSTEELSPSLITDMSFLKGNRQRKQFTIFGP